MPASDQEFVDTLRGAIERYFAAVDAWESAYTKYYRLPGGAKQSADLATERREFETRRRKLVELLPRAKALCFRYGLSDVFTGLLHASLGEFAPQERTDSSISRGERGAAMACLIELSVACRGAEAGLSFDMNQPARKRSLLERIIGLIG